MRALVAPLFLLTSLGAIATLQGCGGGGGASTDGNMKAQMGRVHVEVAWPVSKSRVIPTNARSIKITVKDESGAVCGTALIVRPSTSATIADIPVGANKVSAMAYESLDGTGTALAWADVSTAVLDNATSTVSLTLTSTIDHLEYAPNPFIVGAGTSLGLIITAKDASGNSVMLDPTALSYLSSDNALLSIGSDGTVTAHSLLGIGTITATEATSGKSITIAAGVSLGVIVSPPLTTLNVNATTNFSATILGTLNQGVTWSVRESNGGTISAAGVYTAPSHRGTYHVEATSIADGTRKTSALVTVTAGSINAEVN